MDVTGYLRCVPVIFIVGYFLFIQKAGVSVWLLPWALYSLGAVLAFINGVVASFIQGCGQVSVVQRIGLRAAIYNTVVLMFGLIFHFGLFALSLAILVGNIAYFISLIVIYRKLILNVLKIKKIEINWKRDILGLLWKYAISWSSGYLIFQVYTPFMYFQFHGAVEAGKVGITMSLVSAVFGISNTWFTANTPKMNMLVAKRNGQY